MLEAVVFDFDGVVAGTLAYYFKHMKRLLKEHHGGITDKDVNNLVSRRFTEEFELLRKSYGLSISTKEFREKAYALALEDMHKTLELDPDFKKLLVELKARKVKVAIASNSPRPIIESLLGRLGLRGTFMAIVSGDDVNSYKPMPEVYLEALKRLGAKAENTVAVEDTSVGLEAAVSAGLRTVVVPGKHTKHHDFAKAALVANKGFKELSHTRLEGLARKPPATPRKAAPA